MQKYGYTNRTIFDKIIEHKYLFLSVLISFIFAGIIYVGLANKVYRSDATIQILPKNSVLDGIKINPIQNSSYERYFQTQMGFLKSRYLISKVVEKLNSNVIIYEKKILNHYKVFKQKPSIKIKKFKVKDNTFYYRLFKIKIIDSKTYSISLVSNNLLDEKLSKPIVAKFNKNIKTKYIDLTISKQDSDTPQKEYYIKVLPLNVAVDNAILNLRLERQGDKSTYLQIFYDSNSPYVVKDFLDKLIEVYTNIINKTQTTQVDNFLNAVNNEIKKIKLKLDKNEQKLLTFSQKNRTSGLEKQTDNLVDTIYNKEKELEELNIKYENLKNILIQLRDSRDYSAILTLLSNVNNNNLEILLQSIIELEKKYQTLKEKYKAAHPKMIEIRKELIQKKIILKRNLIELFKSVRNRKNDLKSSIDLEKSSLILQPKKEIGLSKLKREHEQLEKVYLSLLDKKEKLKLSTKITQDYMIKVVDEPYIPTFHIKPKGFIVLALFTIIGGLVGLLLVLLKDFFQKKIITPDDIKELTKKPLLGSVTNLKEDNNIAQNLIWQIRNSLENYKKDKCLVVGISSLVRGEGKSTLVSNLAVALGDGDKKVIVLSLDLRLPTIHKKFNIDNRFGLTNVMYEDMDINNIIKKVKGVKNLYILPSGTIIQNPMKIVNSDFMKVLIKELRKVFDYIVIDLAPISVAVETAFMMKQTDLNIFVLKSNYSKKEYIKEIEEIVKANDIKNIAFILNGLNQKYVKYFTKENEKYIKQSEIL